MAKLTLVELTNVSQFFGKSEYAMFLATTQNNQIVECGITHNSLKRKGFSLDSLNNLVGCHIITKEFTDSRTGELINPEDRIQMILDGDARLVLFNSINCSVVESEVYKQEKKDFDAAVRAKTNKEVEKEEKMEKLMASQQRSLTRALAAAAKAQQPTKQAPDLDLSLETQDDATEQDSSPEAVVETADDIEF